jgi:3-oxoadipate enol-lactonase
VLVHEGVADSRMWEGQWEPFSLSHRVVRYDMRGFGRTPLPPESYSHAEDLIDLLTGLEMVPATLVGASLGGRVALEIAAVRPDLVSALVLVGTVIPGHKWSGEIERYSAAEDAALENHDIDAAVEINLRTWVDGTRAPDAVDPGVRAFVGEMQRRAFELQLAAGDEADEELLEPGVSEHLAEIVQPVLVIVGEDDNADIHEIAARLLEELPNARHESIPRAAHVVPLERPAEFNSVVLEFLEKNGL